MTARPGLLALLAPTPEPGPYFPVIHERVGC